VDRLTHENKMGFNAAISKYMNILKWFSFEITSVMRQKHQNLAEKVPTDF
jgi:hypothetical protein